VLKGGLKVFFKSFILINKVSGAKRKRFVWTDQLRIFFLGKKANSMFLFDVNNPCGEKNCYYLLGFSYE
jgi:hypothetical protein